MFHVPYFSGGFSFSPIFFHASFVTEMRVVILGVHDSATLLHLEATKEFYNPPGSFSPDGSFFACETQMCDISVWRCTPTGYIPWCTVQPRLPCDGFSFSPTTTSILTWGQGGIQLLHLDNCVSPSVPNITRSYHPGLNYLVTIPADGAWIAIAQQHGQIVTMLDPLLGTSQHSINTKSQIQDIKSVNNTLLVFDRNRLVKWDIKTNEATEIEINPEILALLHHSDQLALSVNGAWIAFLNHKLIVYDIKAQQVVSSCEVKPAFFKDKVEGVKFSPCGSKLWFWYAKYDDDPRYQFIMEGYFIEAEIEGGHIMSRIEQSLTDEWSLLAFLQSQDGFCIGHGGRWVEDSRGRKVFWLPPSWRVRKIDELIWEGNFLALVNCHHKEPIIIEFQP